VTLSDRQKSHLACVAALFFVVLVSSTALADLYGADLSFLSEIAGTSASELSQVSQVLTTAQQEYQQAKKVAGYADDAVRAYQSFQTMGSQLFSGNAVSVLSTAFPEVGEIQRAASGTGPWAQGTGELTRVISACLTGSACFQTGAPVTVANAKTAITGTFGQPLPVAGGIETQAMDHEAATGIAAASSQLGKDQEARTQAKALMKNCTGGTDDDSLAACQAASGAATILQAQQTADLTDQIAESNRLESVRVAQENGRRKREIDEAVQRRLAVFEGLDQILPPGEITASEAVEGAQ
jgi:hypothetical protein